jgi:hypothetical protein
MSCCEETLHAPPAIFGRLFVVDLAIVGMEAVLRAGIDVNENWLWPAAYSAARILATSPSGMD